MESGDHICTHLGLKHAISASHISYALLIHIVSQFEFLWQYITFIEKIVLA